MANTNTKLDLPGPRNFWMKTHIQQRGHMLEAICYIVAAGSPEIFRVAVDLRPIARAVKQYHRELHRKAKVEGCIGCEEEIAGLFSSIGNVIKKVGRSKLLKGVSRFAKSVVKSKITAGVIASTAAIFPPVGAPAIAAYAGANASLAAVEKGNKVRLTIRGALRTKRSSKRTIARSRANVRTAAALAARARATRARDAARLKAARASRARARYRARLAARQTAHHVAPSVRTAIARRRAAQRKLNYAAKHKAVIARTMQKSDKAKKYIKQLVATSRYSPDANKRFEASKGSRIYALVAEHRRNLANIEQPKAAVPGLVVDSQGRIIKGKFVQESASRGATLHVMLAAKGKVQPGYFRRVSGCIGCT
jgi:hypothetical protein